MALVDYIVLASYLVFLLTLGPIFNRFNRNASDYFRAGGTMVWWVAGTAVIMGGFSAWSFTGGAARVYETGFFFLVLFGCNFVSMWFTFFFMARKFRQMRIVTIVEAIRKRFGAFNEQLFTWIQVPLGLFFGGVGLYTLAVFSSGAFGLNVIQILLLLAVIVTVMAVAGGAWAINAGQFVQAMLFLIITGVMVYTTLAHKDVGGLSGLIEKLPAKHLDWTQFERPSILSLFIGTMLFGQLVQMNSIREGAGKYLIVKNGRDARKVTLLAIVSTVVLTPMWMIPAMGSVIVHPNLAAQYPELKNAHEAAYVAMARTTLPPGLLGLLVCAIFSASLDNLSGAINSTAGVLVRNFYIRVVNVNASERSQVWLGRVLSILCGFAMTAVALLILSFSDLPLYQLVLLSAAAIGLPQAVPMFLGLFIRRAPSWSLWSTVGIGFAASLAMQLFVKPEHMNAIWRGGGEPLSKFELTDLRIAIVTGGLIAICSAWFLLCAWIGRHTMPAEERRYVDAFFDEMNRPVDESEERAHGSYEDDERQYRVLAVLSLTFGGFIALLSAWPNTMGGRLGLLGCGVTIATVGAVLYAVSRRKARPIATRTLIALNPRHIIAPEVIQK